MLPLSFSARVVSGAGRGKDLGAPTINLDLSQVPSSLEEGIYACMAVIDGKSLQAAMHYGPRPVFKDSLSCEVHLLDVTLEHAPETLEVEVVAYLREVRDFPTPEDLMTQIADDILKTRAILDDHEGL